MNILEGNKTLNRFAVVLLHLVILATSYWLLLILGVFDILPNNSTIQQWDANWYWSIAEEGYSYRANEQCNIAFFPLFPLFWKASQFSPMLISGFNLLAMIIGILLIQRTLQFDNKKLLLFLSIPSLFFCYVPYSEALFFLAGAIIIYGLYVNNLLVTIAGIALACLNRSASLIFIPVILFMQLYAYPLSNNKRKWWMHTLLMIVVSIICTLVVQYIQYIETGQFFAIFEVQKSWSRVLSMPKLPLTTWYGADRLWLDGLAFFAGLLAIVYCLNRLFEWIKQRTTPISPTFLFSMGYLAMVTIVTLLYSNAEGPTSIYSLNRFVFASPFFTVFLFYQLNTDHFNRKKVTRFVLLSLFTWTLFKAYASLPELSRFHFPILKTQIYFALVFAYSFIYLVITNKVWFGRLFYPLYILNVFVQVYLFNAFICGKWVG